MASIGTWAREPPKSKDRYTCKNIFGYATTNVEKNHAELRPAAQPVVSVGIRLDPSQVHTQLPPTYLETHIAQMAESPSVESITKMLEFVDNPNVSIRKTLCQQLHVLSQHTTSEKEKNLLKEGLNLLQKDKNPIIRLYLAQLTRK